MARLDRFLLPEDGRNSFTAPYRPSIFLCCILVLLAAASIITLPTELLIFPIITYCPTIHFALQSIIRTRRQSHTGPESTKAAALRATVLAIFWVITEAAHVLLWYANRKDPFGLLFLNPVLPGSEATLIMVYIAIRYNLHERVTRQNRIVLSEDEENTTTNEASLPVPTPDSGAIGTQEEVSIIPAEPAAIDIYQPSIITLAASISLTVFIAVDDAQRTFYRLTPFLWIIVLIQAYSPTILFQLYVITRIIRRTTQTPEDLSGIAGICFEITVFWIWARVLFVSYLFPLYPGWAFLPGVVETLMMVYLSARYAISLSRAAKSYWQSDHASSIIASEPIHTDSQILSTTETQGPEVYHPSIFILFAVLLLAVMCAYTEISNEAHIGIPISVLVYAPTVAVFLHWTVQSFNHDSVVGDHDPGLPVKDDSAVEWAIGLFAIWALTQAFYVFFWPFNRYYDVAMNPYIRWPAVGFVGYVAVRYAWDRRRRERRIERGAIALPVDIPQEEGGASLA